MIQNLYFDDPFPGISIPECSGKDSINIAITTEHRVLQCCFKDFDDGPVINALDNINKFHVDQTAFFRCYSNNQGGAIRIDTKEISEVVITRTCACDCKCGYDLEGNFARLSIGTTGKFIASMIAINQCEKESMTTFHTILVFYGVQLLSNINNTNCKCMRNSGFSSYYSNYSIMSYCNLVGNEMKETLLLLTSIYTVYRFFNIIENTCSSLGEVYLSLIHNREEGSFLFIENSYFYKNICTWLVQNEGIMSFRCCHLDSITSTGNAVSIKDEINNGKYRMTLLASCGLHADIPYVPNLIASKQLKELRLVISFFINALLFYI